MRRGPWNLASFLFIFAAVHWYGFGAAVLVGAAHVAGYAEASMFRTRLDRDQGRGRP